MKKLKLNNRKLVLRTQTIFLLQEKLISRLNGGTATTTVGNDGGQSTDNKCMTQNPGNANCKTKYNTCGAVYTCITCIKA